MGKQTPLLKTTMHQLRVNTVTKYRQLHKKKKGTMPTFWLCIFQNNSNKFWNIKVGSIMQGIHICPAAA